MTQKQFDFIMKSLKSSLLSALHSKEFWCEVNPDHPCPDVIKEIHIRREVLEDVYSLLKPNGVLYAYVHEGSKADQEQGARQTTKGWQNFRKTGDYLDEIHEVFPGAYVKYGILICPKSAGAAKTAASMEIDSDDLIFV